MSDPAPQPDNSGRWAGFCRQCFNNRMNGQEGICYLFYRQRQNVIRRRIAQVVLQRVAVAVVMDGERAQQDEAAAPVEAEGDIAPRDPNIRDPAAAAPREQQQVPREPSPERILEDPGHPRHPLPDSPDTPGRGRDYYFVYPDSPDPLNFDWQVFPDSPESPDPLRPDWEQDNWP
ncbi:uncharacterized protein LOC128998843 [Macrosteles quadrilineatus]|uniref:uncharacterized protein LOC128998843 n=1 Tax=Macrosteles quadrilineatus TaxID=74068 RepID=UPI0023E14E56|nr:uncharacterized protein LOC128998843 [Macrosteles quadrilineatus]